LLGMKIKITYLPNSKKEKEKKNTDPMMYWNICCLIFVLPLRYCCMY
jgi:hypothetical protein